MSPPRLVVAYLILAHRAPEQLERLVRTLPAESPVFVHVDRNAPPAVFERMVALLQARPQLQFVDRHASRWGTIGIVAGTLSLVRALVASGVHYEYATLLSGADYPLKSPDEIAAYLAAHRGQEFIESFSLVKPNRWSQSTDYCRSPQRVVCRHLRFRSRVLRLPLQRRMPLGLEPHGGWQWWTLSRAAMEYLDQFVREHPDVVRFFSHSFIPDETFVQTVLSNSRFAAHIVPDNLRVIVWDRPQGPYPAVLLSADLPMLLSTHALFGRKFVPEQDAAVLDRLDERIARPPPAAAAQ